ncbi:hypothetical protein [Micromonospora sp. NPDC003776]
MSQRVDAVLVGLVPPPASATTCAPLATVSGDLGRPGSRLDVLGGDDVVTDLRSVFVRSHTALDPAAARLFALLGAWSEPEVTLAAAASLAGVPAADVRRMLARLAESHPAVERMAGRYVVHDLLLEYAGELDLDDTDAGGRSVADSTNCCAPRVRRCAGDAP